MQPETFRRVLRTFADPDTEFLIERDKLVVQVNNDLVEAGLKFENGNLFVIDDEVKYTAYRWIVERIAKIPLLADRIISSIRQNSNYISPKGTFMNRLDSQSAGEDLPFQDVLADILTELDNKYPLSTRVMYITSDAGEGKTSLINEVAINQAKKFKQKNTSWILVPIQLGGRNFLRFDDIVVGVLQNQFRFPYFYYDSFIELVKLGVIVPAFDGFEEMFVENSSGDALSAMGMLVNSLESSGCAVIAARKAYFDFQNLKMQSRIFDTYKGNSVEFERISLQRWDRERFIAYAEKLGIDRAATLYETIKNRLGENHSVLTRPVLVDRLLKVYIETEDIDEFVAKISASGTDFFHVFVAGIVEREAYEKWNDRKGGDVSSPLIPLQDHFEILSAIALEMWVSRQDFLREDSIQAVADLFCEHKKYSTDISFQVKNRIKGHSLFTSGTAARILQFDHDEFRQFFLAESLAYMALHLNNTLRAELGIALRKGVFPEQTVKSFAYAIKRNNGNVMAIVRFLCEVAELDGQASYANQNASSIVMLLLNGLNFLEKISVRKLTFPENSMIDMSLSNIVFEQCYFNRTSLENTRLSECEFHNCGFSRLEIGEKVISSDTLLDSCTIDAVFLRDKNVSIFEPSHVMASLRAIGFVLENGGETEEDSTVEVNEEVEQLSKLLRYFMRSTHISESVLRIKLGGRGNAFIANAMPVLLDVGVFEEIENRGGNDQRRFKLGRPMEDIVDALEKCMGSFEQFKKSLSLSTASASQ